VDAKRLMTVGGLVASVALATPAAAAAQEPTSCLPNQSVAVLDQYCDALITPGGSSQPIGSRAPGKPLSKVLPAGEVRALRESGRAGKALLTLTAATTMVGGPNAVTAPTERRRRSAARPAVVPEKLKPPTGDVASITSGVVAVSPDVLSGAFRWGLVICTLGLAGMTWLRLRARLKL
jgi:hypothetical protein